MITLLKNKDSIHGYLPVEVEITITSGGSGLHPFTMFHPQNPFLRRGFHRPLPFMGYSHKFDNARLDNMELFTVVEEEFIVDPPTLNLDKAFKCFEQIPSSKAKYSIKLCVDVPNNRNPMACPPYGGSEVGHSFVVLTKKNGTQSVTQVFGFYPQKTPGLLNAFDPFPSVIKDNGGREINASIEMSLTEAQFKTIREKALELARKKYDLGANNCTDFALNLFNAIRPTPITIEKLTIFLPSNVGFVPKDPETIRIKSSPQMLFTKLKEMRNAGGQVASDIVIDQTSESMAPISQGKCN
jgi:hypothetical protein